MPRYTVTENDIARAQLELALSGKLSEEAYRNAGCRCDASKRALAEDLLAGYLNAIHVAQGGQCLDDMELAPYPLLIGDVRRSIRDQLDELSVTDVIDVLEELCMQPGMPEAFEFSDEALDEDAPVKVILACIAAGCVPVPQPAQASDEAPAEQPQPKMAA